MFSPKMWPEWTEADLAAAVADFQMRERRFGSLPAAS
jgi:undecaprenyl pyrophosphate synthase